MKRLLLLVAVSRGGVLEQDLYEALNAHSHEAGALPPCRVSWQEFALLCQDLRPLVMPLRFGALGTLLCPRGRAVHRALLRLMGDQDEVGGPAVRRGRRRVTL